MTIRFDHVGDCTFPTSGSCTCGAMLPIVDNAWPDGCYHPFTKGHSYHDPGRFCRIGPRGGRKAMTHGEKDREALAACVTTVVRGAGHTLALCDRPRFQHPGHEEEIRFR